MKAILKIHYLLCRAWRYVGHKDMSLFPGSMLMSLLLHFYFIYIIIALSRIINFEILAMKNWLYVSFFVLTLSIHLWVLSQKKMYIKQLQKFKTKNLALRKKSDVYVSVFVALSFLMIFPVIFMLFINQ